VTSSGKNDEGSLPKSSQHVPSSAQIAQELRESEQHEKDEALEDEPIIEEELA
jgi:hypothetical protein